MTVDRKMTAGTTGGTRSGHVDRQIVVIPAIKTVANAKPISVARTGLLRTVVASHPAIGARTTLAPMAIAEESVKAPSVKMDQMVALIKRSTARISIVVMSVAGLNKRAAMARLICVALLTDRTTFGVLIVPSIVRANTTGLKTTEELRPTSEAGME